MKNICTFLPVSVCTTEVYLNRAYNFQNEPPIYNSRARIFIIFKYKIILTLDFRRFSSHKPHTIFVVLFALIFQSECVVGGVTTKIQIKKILNFVCIFPSECLNKFAKLKWQ